MLYLRPSTFLYAATLLVFFLVIGCQSAAPGVPRSNQRVETTNLAADIALVASQASTTPATDRQYFFQYRASSGRAIIEKFHNLPVNSLDPGEQSGPGVPVHAGE